MSGIQTIYWAIQYIVDEQTTTTGQPISRDQIAMHLLDEPETRLIVRETLKAKSPSEEQLWRKAGNYVDWLVADIKGGDRRSSPWNGGRYVITRGPNKHPFSGKMRPTNWLMPSSAAEAELVESIRRDNKIPYTERVAIIQARVGQGLFRQQLIEMWGSCVATGCDELSLLRASHIKPWRDCTNEERLDAYNGLLLAPNIDAAFDQGLISFDDAGRVVCSTILSASNLKSLGIGRSLRIRLNLLTQSYLAYHRKHVFRDDDA